MKKEIVVIRLNKKVHDWCKEKAKEEGMNKSEFIRKIITDYVEGNQNIESREYILKELKRTLHNI